MEKYQSVSRVYISLICIAIIYRPTIKYLILGINLQYFILMLFPEQFRLIVMVLVRVEITLKFIQTCEVLFLFPQRVVIALFYMFVSFCNRNRVAISIDFIASVVVLRFFSTIPTVRRAIFVIKLVNDDDLVF